MGFNRNVFIISAGLVFMFVMVNCYEVSSYGENVLTTKLTNGDIFVLMLDKKESENENERSSKYVIISSDGETIGEEHVLHKCGYTDKANLQTLSEKMVVLADNNKFYLINYNDDTCKSINNYHYTGSNSGTGMQLELKDSILGRIALAVNIKENEFIIADVRENSKQIVRYNAQGEKQTFTEITSKDIKNLECGVIGTEEIKYICFYTDTNNGWDIYYRIFDKTLLSDSSELEGNGNGDIYFQGSNNKGIKMISMDTNVYLLCGLFEVNSSFHVICLTLKEKENKNDSNPIIKIAHYKDESNDHFSVVQRCKGTTFSIASISSTNFIATCEDNNKNVLLSVIKTEGKNMSFQENSKNILTLSDPIYSDLFTITKSNKRNYAIIYIKNNKVIFYYVLFPNCKDYNVGSFKYGEKGFLYFSKYIDFSNNLYQMIPDEIGIKITDYNNERINIYIGNNKIISNEEYSFDEIFTFEIQHGTLTNEIEQPYKILFQSNVICEGKLIFNIKSCHKACSSCKNVGDESNMRCTSCSENSYPKEEEKRNNIEFNCYSTVPDGYCDSEQTPTLGWKKCNKACVTCSKCSENEDETLCETCNEIEDYYPLNDNNTQCYSKDRNDLGRFLNNEKKEWEQCDTRCKTCVEKNKCTSCNNENGFYLLQTYNTDNDGSLECYDETSKPTNTFLDETLRPQMYQYCNDACGTCKSKGYFSFDTKCETCAKNYCEFSKENINDISGEDVSDGKQCYHKNTKINNYYVIIHDDGTCKFDPCPINCTQCSKDSISENKCISCNRAEGYYPIQQDSTKNNHIECYLKGDKIEGLFFDEKKNIFKRCDKACRYCSKQSTSISTNCDECAENYFPLEESKSKCYHKDENKKGYYLESDVFKKCSEACVDCSIAPADGKTNCDKQLEGSSCSKYYAPIEEEDNTNNESTQSELPSYVQCYDISQKSIDNYYYNKDKNVFSRCHEACASCTELGDNTNTKCTQCDSSRNPPYYQVENTNNNNNVFHCCTEGNNPKNTFFDNGIFKLCHKSCLTCSSKGVDNNSLCDECDTKNGYYMMNNIDGKLNCINEELKDKYYSNMYLDEKYEYKECGKECAKCSQGEHMCTECAEEFNFRYDHIQNKQTTDCINEDTKHPDYSNYYLSTDDGLYKICHSNCEKCSKGGNDSNNECDTCISPLVLHPSKDKHCVQPCEFYYYITNDNVYSCTSSNECPVEYHFVYEHEGKCSNKCTEPYVFHENECLIDCPEETEKDINSDECLPKDRCRIKQNAETIPLNEVSNNIDTIAKNYANEYLSTEKVVALHTHISNKYTISLFKNSECFSSLIHDLLMIDLASCIDILKQHYNIDTSLYLIILKLDIPRKGQSNQVAYSIYHPITGERLELELCSEEKVTVKVPLTETPGVNVTEAMTFKDLGVDVYNLSDPFFTDICVNYAVDGKDTTLKDRREHFYQNVSFCESGCEFKGVNLTTLEADCVCEIKTDFITDVLDNPITGDVLEMLSSLNFDLMKCYQGVFDIGNAKVNVGGFIMLGFIVAQIAFMIVYIVKGLDNVRKFVDSYVAKGNPPHKGQPNELIITKNDNDNNNSQVTVADEISQTNTNTNRKRLISTQTGENLILKDVNNSASIDFGEQFQPALKPSKLMIMVVNHQNGMFLDDNIAKKRTAQKLRLPTNRKRNVPIKHINKNIRRVNLKRKSTSTNSKENASVNEDKNNQSFEEEDLNEMEHYDAIIYDKRSFCAFYWNQLKIKHPFINTFIDIDVLEVFPIKAICFILNVALLFTLNALLYSEEHISETFNNKAAKSNLVALFTDEITRIVYVSMISIVIDYMIDCLFSGKKRILTVVKREEDEEKMKKECMDTIKCMKVKNIIFLIVNFVIMGFFWYYVNAFCNCYKNTVTSWIVSCFVTWGVLLVFPFVVCLLVTVLRFVGLKCKIEILYKLSLCLTD